MHMGTYLMLCDNCTDDFIAAVLLAYGSTDYANTFLFTFLSQKGGTNYTSKYGMWKIVHYMPIAFISRSSKSAATAANHFSKAVSPLPN